VSGSLVVAAPAKVNLFLHVGEKRADGYHDIQSLAAFTTCGDEISLEPDDGISLSLNGPFGTQLSGGGAENLALKAAKLLAEKTGTKRGARIGLRKNLPVASGLGGGSADAAAVLRGLDGLWQSAVGHDRLREIAGSLGADVPVCIDSVTSWMEGKGERVRPLPPLPNGGVLLVNPGVQVPTAQVFAALGRRRGQEMLPPPAPFLDAYALICFLKERANDLELPARMIAPVITEVLRETSELPEVLLARMSGSGATCFGLFADEATARAAALLLRARRPEWWVCETTFIDTPANVST
jgi:4-diphosphocytidyl-2-C-methyl-D-erythritol kinase